MIQAPVSVTCHSFKCGALPTVVNISRFQGVDGVEEYHLTIQPTEYGSAVTQLKWISGAYQDALDYLGLNNETCIFRRFFCSDLANQASILDAQPFSNPNHPNQSCAVSRICQPPALPAKASLWAYHVNDPRAPLSKIKDGPSLLLQRGDLTHYWTAGITHSSEHASYVQTRRILREYESILESAEMRMADHVVRTWFFVRDVDANYQGLVDARREIFAERGMTPDTHYIASTGIEGASADPAVKVTMDAYAISGIRGDQIRYISAPANLSPTHIYGVTFERGVSVSYADRKHILISGTASIDSAGEILYHGNVLQQMDQALENVRALLEQAEATLRDVCVFTVYVRDPSDLAAVQKVMKDRFGHVPYLVVLAPVCRPGWLVEMECQAIIPDNNPALPGF
ncbi:MAG TPA: Rid family hydrolase [Armatimonadota bacterium]|nr:Rid family hydrolase [Armatimonadota bacterium]